MPDTLHKQVTDQYYRTTAGRGHVPDRAHYDRSAGALLRWVAPWLPEQRDAECLDLACGCGEFIYLLEREGFQQTAGVDLCAEEVEEARKFVRGNVVQEDILVYLRRRPTASVDFITAFNIFEHLPKDTLRDVLHECRRVLRRGGTLVAMVPNAASPFSGISRHWDITHEWAFTQNNFRQLAGLLGFADQIEFRECGPRPHGLKSLVRSAGWQVIRWAIAVWLLVEVGQTKGGVYTMDMLVRLRVE